MSIITCGLGGTSCNVCDFIQLVEGIFYWLMAMAFAVAVFFVVLSGFTYIFSIGSKELTKIAKRILWYSITGFLICLVGWLSIHSIYKAVGYSGGDWWTIECNQGGADIQTQDKNLNTQKVSYANEIQANALGGRDNPIALSDLAVSKLSDIPDNKYFFIHGIGGQSLESAAKQLVQITQEAQIQKKIVYAVVPTGKLDNNNSAESTIINVSNYIAQQDSEKTLKNFKNLLVQLVEDSPSSEIPLVVTSTSDKLAKYNNVWPVAESLESGLITQAQHTLTSAGVLYRENRVDQVVDQSESAASKTLASNVSTYYTLNFKYDDQNDRYYLNQDDPITFDFPKDVSKEAATQAVQEIADIVGQSVKDSYAKDQDQLSQLMKLMSKDIIPKEEEMGSVIAETQTKEATTYDPGILPSDVIRNLDQIATPQQVAKAQQEYDKLAKDLIDQELADYGSYEGGNLRDMINKATQSQNTQGLQDVKDALDSQIAKQNNKVEGSPNGVPTPVGGFGSEDTGILDDVYGVNSGSTVGDRSSLGENDADEIAGAKTTKSSSSGSANPSTGSYSAPPVNYNNYPSEAEVEATVNSVKTYAFSELKARVSTGRVLSLEDRDKIREEIVSLSKEFFKTTGQNLNIDPDFVMCLYDKESVGFDAGASSTTGCVGLPQICGNESRQSLQYLKKYAPDHYKALSEKVQEDQGKSLEQTIMSKNDDEARRKMIRKDPNLSAALGFAYINIIINGWNNGKGKPVSTANNYSDYRRIIGGYIDPDDSSWFPSQIMSCYKDKNGWWRELRGSSKK